MNKSILTSLFACLALTFYGQQRIPVFSNSNDSIHYFNVTEQLKKGHDKIFTGTQQQIDSILMAKDSLHNMQQAIMARSLVRWHYLYTPDMSFTSYETLKTGAVDPLSVTHLSIAHYKGEALPEEVLQCKNVIEIELVNTAVGKIQKQLNKLKKLQGIYIYNNGAASRLKLERNRRVNFLRIAGDPDKLPDDFSKFKRLDSLDLKRNALTSFPALYKNKRLKALSLSENMLTLENLHLRKNRKLEQLFLRDNRITTVPAEISKLKGLKGIVLNDNQITSIEPGFEKLTALEQISFYKNKLSAIPETLFKMKNLRELDLYFNQITRVDSKICELKNLKVLYLSHNKIFSLPDCISELSQLNGIYVHHNMLTTLPASFSKLHNLSILRINNNIFTDIPQSILQLNNLETLDISYNQLSKLPEELFNLKKLRLFALEENPWTDREQIVSIAKALREKGTTVNTNTLANVLEDR